MQSYKQLHEKRGGLLKEAEAVLTSANVEKREVSPSENIRLDNIKSEIFNVDQSLAKLQAEMRMNQPVGSNSGEMNLEGYSISRAIRCAAGGRIDGLEGEASAEITRRSGTAPSGFWVPNGVLVESRAMSVTGGTAQQFGGAAVATTITDFLAALRPISKVIGAGATLFSGLTSNIAIPVQNAASTASWKTEVAALDEVTSEISQIVLSPKRVGAFTVLSNQLLIQSAPSIDQFIKRDLLGAIATAIDAAAINGAGGAAPTGILGTNGIGAVVGGTNGAAPAWADIVALIGAVADANADFGELAFLTNSKVLAKLRSTPKVTSTDSMMILEGNSLLEYLVYGSNNVPSNLTKGSANAICSAIIFGNWQDLLIGSFGNATELIVDPFTAATTGQTRVIAQSYVDIAVRRAASFAAFQDCLTA